MTLKGRNFQLRGPLHRMSMIELVRSFNSVQSLMSYLVGRKSRNSLLITLKEVFRIRAPVLLYTFRGCLGLEKQQQPWKLSDTCLIHKNWTSKRENLLNLTFCTSMLCQ